MKMDFDALKKRNAMALHDLKEQGKHVVGMFCTYSPKELIYAAGAVPVGLCAYDESPIDAAHAELPRNLCPLIKASYGYAVTKKCPYMNASDLVIGETTCDGKKKMYELLAKYKDKGGEPRSRSELYVAKDRLFKTGRRANSHALGSVYRATLASLT